MAIRVICIGKKHEDWVKSGIDRYQKRLYKPFDVAWQYLPHSSGDDELARRDESAEIIKKLSVDDFVVLLDERGQMYDSPALTGLLLAPLEHSQQLVIVIGGAYGVDESLKRRADAVWSLSPLVFPHQLVRLILIEQLYRAQKISDGHPYHHV